MESLGRGGAGVPEFTPRGREPDFPLLPGQLWGPLPLRGGGGTETWEEDGRVSSPGTTRVLGLPCPLGTSPNHTPRMSPHADLKFHPQTNVQKNHQPLPSDIRVVLLLGPV